jgi:hypothetical protein
MLRCLRAPVERPPHDYALLRPMAESSARDPQGQLDQDKKNPNPALRNLGCAA